MKWRGIVVWILLLILGLALFVQFLLKTKVDPLVSELARAQISDLASNLINEAIDRQLADGDFQYTDLVTLQQDHTGAITAVTTNMQEMNRLKTKLLITLDDSIQTLNSENITVPMGNITGIPMLSGRGPEIPVKVVAISSSDATFRGEFQAAGINQTIHKIMLDVSLELLIILPNGTVTECVSSDVCVAETVLLGEVPESYTYFGGSGDSGGSIYYAAE